MRHVAHHEVQALLPMSECMEVMRELFATHYNQPIINPLRYKMWLPDMRGVMGLMPAYIESLGVMGIKVLSVFPENYKQGLSSHQGIVVLFEAATGQLLCTFDADAITAIRTAAVSGLMTNLLARQDAISLALIGTGEQAHSHLAAVSLVRDVKKVLIWSPTRSKMEQFAATESLNYPAVFELKGNIEETVAEADIICTLTPSPVPVLQSDWVKAGTHINAVGASTPKARELDSQLVAKSRLFIDNYESALNESGDILIPMEEGVISQSHIIGDISALLSKTCEGRTNGEEITLFKSLGIAVEDVAAAHHIYKKLHL